MSEKKNKPNVTHIILTVVGVVLCAILLPILIVNITLIIKGATNKDDVPMVGGYFPLIVQSDSMKGIFESGDLTVNKALSANEVKIGDIIVFFDPDSSNGITVTHRVVDIIDDGDGTLSFLTKGDANNTVDSIVPQEKLIGKYCFRIAKMGNVAMFMQSTAGLIVCVLVPLLALVAYEIARRMIEKKKGDDQQDLKDELEMLKAEKAKLEAQVQGSAVDENIATSNDDCQPQDAQPTNSEQDDTQDAQPTDSVDDTQL